MKTLKYATYFAFRGKNGNEFLSLGFPCTKHPIDTGNIVITWESGKDLVCNYAYIISLTLCDVNFHFRNKSCFLENVLEISFQVMV